jgi:hypothetical protein
MYVFRYKAAAGSNTFAPVASTAQNFVIPAGVTAAGTVYNALITPSVAMVAEERVLWVWSATATGLSLVQAVSGYVSGGSSWV